MNTVKQLVEALRGSTGSTGVYMFGAYPHALGRYGFSSLTEPYDRQRIRLLQATSAHMAQGDEPDNLVLHICTASVIEMDDEFRQPVLDLRSRIYCPDGSEPSPVAHTILSAFSFPSDMALSDATVESDEPASEEPKDLIEYSWWKSLDPVVEEDRGYSSQVSTTARASFSKNQ
jgi:hypothetical protein